MKTTRPRVDSPEQGRPSVHFTASYLLNPTNPLTVNLIGAGGTGSQVLTLLARMNHAFTELGHPGLQVRLWDGDTVSQANLGRQLFAHSELKLNKAVALINRVNGFFGTNWKAVPTPYCISRLRGNSRQHASANLFITCVDTVSARREIALILQELRVQAKQDRVAPDRVAFDRDRPYYWLDYGNSQQIGQVILSTVGEIEQPPTQEYVAVGQLPFITDEFDQLLLEADQSDNTPSCSLAEALQKQELFINSTLANHGCSLLWTLFRKAMTPHRGCFLNLETGRTAPLPIA
ncbi:PRTRC system ThiF family protein [Spirosoma pollinicola]|uniref:THIF-type NAD/FAD binding fold domain-containing protein n=1 Tax=Spirosoma pollinicola TaxID=2057025 RepID=A0A2K8Z280_9BACT|nr:PRTRC system ThiF family protein [Spirosoma pollinicola]AUD03990.1 hypothetical protein CWM47_20470 [Spirosoma pollinicola]